MDKVLLEKWMSLQPRTFHMVWRVMIKYYTPNTHHLYHQQLVKLQKCFRNGGSWYKLSQETRRQEFRNMRVSEYERTTLIPKILFVIPGSFKLYVSQEFTIMQVDLKQHKISSSNLTKGSVKLDIMTT